KGDKREDEACDERRATESVAFVQQIADEQVHSPSREDERRKEQQVVAENQVTGEVIDREDLDRLAKQMLRERQRQRLGVEDVRVPEVVRRHLPGGDPWQVL